MEECNRIGILERKEKEIIPEAGGYSAGRGENAALPPWVRQVCEIPHETVTNASFESAQPRDIAHIDDTEHLLNGLIAECHFLMRTAALPTVVQAHDADTRARFLNSAMSLASTGAEVGRTIAKLRSAGATAELRQRHVVEHVVTAPRSK
jgi:hypothetical protein